MAEDQEMQGLNPEATPEEEKKQAEQDKKVNAINNVLRSNNDVFRKTYDFPEYDLHFGVALKSMNMVSRGKVHYRFVNYLNGVNNFAAPWYVELFHGLSLIMELGIQEELPYFLKADNIENFDYEDIVVQIGRDYEQWLRRFR